VVAGPVDRVEVGDVSRSSQSTAPDRETQGSRILYRNGGGGDRHDLLRLRTILFSARPVFPTPQAPIAKLDGAVFLSWVVLFLARTVLIARRRRDLHWRLGIVGAVLAGAMVVVGTAVAIVSMRHNFAGGNERALSFFAIPIGDMLGFSILVASQPHLPGGQPDTHKRPMLLATISVLDAAVAPWPVAIMAKGPVAFFPVTDLFIAAMRC
jgi:hypothetical protein